MFRRILHEDWALVIPVISFICIFAFFLIATLRALALGKERRDHLAWLPIVPDKESDHLQTSDKLP